MDRYKDISSIHSVNLAVKKEEKKPIPPPLDRNNGQNLFSKVAHLVGWLKEHNELVRLDDLAIRSHTDELITNSDLLSLFREHERVAYDQKTNLYRYKPDYDIRSKEDLLDLLHRYLPRGGLPIKTLKESWPQAQTAIEDLERQGKVLVTRSGGHTEKEGVAKMVFYNELENIKTVDEEFKLAWHELQTPDEATLPRELEAAGLRTTAAAQIAIVNSGPLRKKKKAGNRRTKISNVHVAGIDLSKDYVAPPKNP